MINTKEDFKHIEAMMQSEGWKLYMQHIDEKAKGKLSQALNDEYKDSEQLKFLAQYKILKDTIQSLYGAYKSAYEIYKGE